MSKEDKMREENHTYELYAIIVHEGRSTFQGHYYAFVRHNGLWYRYDDDHVRLIGPDLSTVKK